MKHTLRFLTAMSILTAGVLAQEPAATNQPVIKFDERYRHVRLAPVYFGVTPEAAAKPKAPVVRGAEPANGFFRWTAPESTGRQWKLGPATVDVAMGAYNPSSRYTMVTGLPQRDWTAGARVEFRF